ncbi:tyrosine-type recombinase/integrase [Akkermansiaceae bacterium]|nr:tyrosine-type recombinase/integrase [Akkermansiaceae bacterium]MDA7540915.1 tyrosine-type recombinase/integrase [bacterium]MDA7607299.1 tyrosine-type recombinase/integrase [Akkermansiaceae bacterium]MDB4390882.1 tyrosine-type recombinase/integrase [Akkermansiaceae bacterium]MDB4448443.1 tyrosine-type recombinase/integrase [Akkermansiaceae bacterium]
MGKGREIEVQELKEANSYRKERGYLYMVEARIAGKRYRRFYRHGEKKNANAYVSQLRAKRDNVGLVKAAILEDPEIQEMAARAVRKLVESGSSLTLEEAVDDYLVRYAETLSRSTVSVSTVIDAFLHEKEREGVSGPHFKDLGHRTNRFAKSFGDRSISAITEKNVSDWLTKLSLEPQTVLNFRRVLHNLFSFAVKRGHISANPVTNALLPKVRRKRAVILSPDEASSLLVHAEDEILPSIAIMLFCGVRQEEMARLDWSAIDFEDSIITISGEIAKREVHERFITMPEALIEWIKPHRKRRGLVKPTSFRGAFERCREASGFPKGTWPANGLRKTFISCHYETHGSIDETARQAGTSVNIIHKYYRRLIRPKEASKLWDIYPQMSESVIPLRA